MSKETCPACGEQYFHLNTHIGQTHAKKYDREELIKEIGNLLGIDFHGKQLTMSDNKHLNVIGFLELKTEIQNLVNQSNSEEGGNQ